MLSTQKSFQCNSMFFFQCENATTDLSSAVDKTAATTASTLVALTAARLTAVGCFSSLSSYGAFKNSSQHCPGFFTTKMKLTGAKVIQRNPKTCLKTLSVRGWPNK